MLYLLPLCSLYLAVSPMRNCHCNKFIVSLSKFTIMKSRKGLISCTSFNHLSIAFFPVSSFFLSVEVSHAGSSSAPYVLCGSLWWMVTTGRRLVLLEGEIQIHGKAIMAVNIFNGVLLDNESRAVSASREF